MMFHCYTSFSGPYVSLTYQSKTGKNVGKPWNLNWQGFWSKIGYTPLKIIPFWKGKIIWTKPPWLWVPNVRCRECIYHHFWFSNSTAGIWIVERTQEIAFEKGLKWKKHVVPKVIIVQTDFLNIIAWFKQNLSVPSMCFLKKPTSRSDVFPVPTRRCIFHLHPNRWVPSKKDLWLFPPRGHCCAQTMDMAKCPGRQLLCTLETDDFFWISTSMEWPQGEACKLDARTKATEPYTFLNQGKYFKYKWICGRVWCIYIYK